MQADSTKTTLTLIWADPDYFSRKPLKKKQHEVCVLSSKETTEMIGKGAEIGIITCVSLMTSE
jgi:hypothetical protein